MCVVHLHMFVLDNAISIPDHMCLLSKLSLRECTKQPIMVPKAILSIIPYTVENMSNFTRNLVVAELPLVLV